jgi:tRNA (guanosine-2'-O-)-methyltransferase
MRPERKQKMEEVLDRRQSDLVIVIENVGDPHNIGAIMRSADSVGVQDIYVINTLISEIEYKTKRSSASAEKWLTIKHFDKIENCIAELKKRGLKIWATHLGVSAEPLHSLDLTQPIALVFGTERKGISSELLKHCDGNFVIPQVGMIQSLNVSVACAVSLYEAFRQRDVKGMYNQKRQIDEKRSNAILKDWQKQYEK